MRKSVTEFRQRFQRWKSGEQVYDKGRVIPHYAEGEDAYYGNNRIEPITGEAGNLGGIIVYGKKPKYNYLKEWPGRTHSLTFSDLGKGIEAATAGFFPNPVLLADDIIEGRNKDAFHHALRDLSFVGGPVGKASILGLGATGLLDENGIQKTINKFNDGDIVGGSVSLFGDVLNTAATIYGGKGLYNYADDIANKIVNATSRKYGYSYVPNYEEFSRHDNHSYIGFENPELQQHKNVPLLSPPKSKRMGMYPTPNDEVIQIDPKRFKYENTPLLAENPRSKYVDSEGNVNMRNVVKLVRQFYNMHPEARNYKEIYNSSGNLYQHIKDVVKSAQEAPVPEGYTRQQLVQAALFHDIGKTLNLERSHDRTSVHIMRELGIQTDADVEDAISRHMSHHLGDQDPLSKALHFVDVARGHPMNSFYTDSSGPQGWDNIFGSYAYSQRYLQEGSLRKFQNLLYPGALKPPVIRPLYHDNTEWQLRNIINPILDEYGYKLTNEQRQKYGLKPYVEGDPQIPFDTDPETARQMVMEFIKMHRTFGRGQHKHTRDQYYENFIKDTKKALGLKESDNVTEDQMYKVGAEYIKRKNTSNGVVGLQDYLNKYELNDSYQALYNATRDETVNYYKDRGADEAGPVYITQMNINDNPNWSLAELWANNEFPVVYSGPGGTSYGTTDWRRMELPFRLNTGLSLSDEYNNQQILQENRRLLQDAKNTATELAKQHEEEYKIKYYDTRPTMYLEGRIGNSNMMGYSGISRLRRFGEVGPEIFKIINRRNDYTREHGLPDIIPPMKSDLSSKETTIKYPVSYMKYDDLVGKIHAIFYDEPSTELKTEDWIAKRKAIGYLQSKGLISGDQMLAALKVLDHGGKDWRKYVGSEKYLLKKAQQFYFKDIRHSRKIDAFIRRKEVEERNSYAFQTAYNSLYVPPKLKTPKSREQIMNEYGVDEDLNYTSPDGYRVFSTERINDPDPSDMGGNHYVIVGKRGSKQMNVVGEYNKPSGFSGNTHGGQQIPGWSRNFGSILPWLLVGSFIGSNYYNNDKR